MNDIRLRQEINILRNELCITDLCDKNTFEWSDLIRNPGRKALIIGATLASLIQLCGPLTMLSYGVKIFNDTGSIISPKISIIVVGAMQILGTCVTIFLVDRVGRKVSEFFIEVKLSKL